MTKLSTPRLIRVLHGWSLPVLLVLAVLLPSVILAWTAWSERERALAEAESGAIRTVIALHEHAAKVLDTHELVLSEVARRVQGRPWEELSRDATLWTHLAGMARDLAAVGSIALVDAEGRVRLTTQAFPAPADGSVADQDHFQAHARGFVGTHAAPVRGAEGGRMVLSRGIADRDGGFAGLVQVAVPISEFTDFWERFAPTIAHVIPLVRSDGQVIARYPAHAVPERLATNGPFLSRALAERSGTYTAVSRVDGIERLSAFTQVKDYPLHLAFSVETRAVLAPWHARVELLTFFTLIATLGLLGMSLMAARQYREQRHAARRWREQADRLAAEMAAREQAEAQLRRAQTLDAVGQLTAGVAHDFNNLLQAVKSGLFLLRKRSAPGDDAAREIMDGALQAVDRGARLVRQMMVFARRERLEPRPVDLRAQVAGMSELLAKALGTGIRVEVEFEEALPAVMADPTQTELALLNLAINARDAMPRTQGVLTIAAREVELHQPDPAAGLEPGRYVALSVADDGDGMPPEVLGRVLEPFFTTKAPGRGTGLGLSMVHGFVAQSGGGMRIESTPGRGTLVTLFLPRADAEAEVEAAAPAQAAPAAGPAATVLLVDDDALGRLATAAALRELGHEVLEARAGDEALLLLQRRPEIELLVTDYAMPGMTGTELSVAARRLRPDLPVVMITGYAAAAPDDLGRFAVAVLRKPFRVEDLDKRLRRLLAVRRRTQEIARG